MNEKQYKVTDKKNNVTIMSESELRASRVWLDTLSSMVFGLNVKEEIFDNERGYIYLRIK